jgi:hypothetical protein
MLGKQVLKLLLLALFWPGATLALYSFSTCKIDIEKIRNGTGNMTNEELQKYIYKGPVHGLNKGSQRSKYLALTYEGVSFPVSDMSLEGRGLNTRILRMFKCLRRQCTNQRCP